MRGVTLEFSKIAGHNGRKMWEHILAYVTFIPKGMAFWLLLTFDTETGTDSIIQKSHAIFSSS